MWNARVAEIHGEPHGAGVTGVTLERHPDRRAPRASPCDGVFVAIGHQPNTALFAGQLELDETGYIVTQARAAPTRACRASSPAATCRISVYRQAVTAAGTGCMAAIDAERWLEAHKHSAG